MTREQLIQQFWKDYDNDMLDKDFIFEELVNWIWQAEFERFLREAPWMWERRKAIWYYDDNE